MPSSQIEMLWRRQPMIPVALNNTDMAFQFDLIKAFISTIMSERFSDITAKPDAPFLSAGFGVGKLCNTCEATSGNVSFKDGEAVKAFTAFMTEVEKLKRYGFTESEVARAKDNIIQHYEKAAEGAATRKNAEFVRPLINNFFFNDPYMTPENELQLVQGMCGMFNAQILNQILPMFLQETNVLILYNGPEKEGLVNPTKEELAQAYASVKTAEIAPNVEESTNEPLLDAAALKGSKVKKEKKTLYGATEWTLKNGVKVTYYTLNCKNYDGKQRNILFYDKDKNLVKFPNDVYKII